MKYTSAMIRVGMFMLFFSYLIKLETISIFSLFELTKYWLFRKKSSCNNLRRQRKINEMWWQIAYHDRKWLFAVSKPYSISYLYYYTFHNATTNLIRSYTWSLFPKYIIGTMRD